MRVLLLGALAFAVPVSVARGQTEAPASTEGFRRAASDIRQELEASLAELSALRERIATEKLPLSQELRRLEGELSEARAENRQASRDLDSHALELTNLRASVKARADEGAYLSNLLGDYLREFEARLHIAEVKRYADPIRDARLAVENTALLPADVYRAQAGALQASLSRLEEALGGARFEGTAVDPGGTVRSGTFLVIGPTAVFRSSDGQVAGTAEQRLGSLEATVIPFPKPEDVQRTAAVITSGSGELLIDPTLGNAQKVEAVRESFVEHVRKGGPVMVPIIVLAGVALLVALYKWVALSAVRIPSRSRIEALLRQVGRGDRQRAEHEVQAVRGPVGAMLAAGVEHLGEPRELIEEVMYESVLATRLKLQRFLPFVAITASAAPLLGLLGTVTGIMNTFTLVTVFGTGDVKTLSSGISEALITTECGLYVAIPSLLLYAFLSRKAKAVIDRMEQAAVAFVNQVRKAPAMPPSRATIAAGAEAAEEPSPRTSQREPAGVAQ